MKCPICKLTHITKRGFRYNKTTGKIQKYYCKDCDKKFIISINYRMRHRKSAIDKALQLRREGNSYSQVCEKMNIKISRKTIMKWVLKYKDWNTKEILIKKWCQGYWRKDFSYTK